MIEPVLCIYGNNWDICYYDPKNDSLSTPWDFNYNNPPLFKLNYTIRIKTGLLSSVYVDKIVIFKNEKEAYQITSEGLKAVNLVHGVKEYWVRAFQESLPEKEEDIKTMLIKNLGLILMAIITIIAILSR